jgi:hypothetical protein
MSLLLRGCVELHGHCRAQAVQSRFGPRLVLKGHGFSHATKPQADPGPAGTNALNQSNKPDLSS